MKQEIEVARDNPLLFSSCSNVSHEIDIRITKVEAIARHGRTPIKGIRFAHCNLNPYVREWKASNILQIVPRFFGIRKKDIWQVTI